MSANDAEQSPTPGPLLDASDKLTTYVIKKAVQQLKASEIGFPQYDPLDFFGGQDYPSGYITTNVKMPPRPWDHGGPLDPEKIKEGLNCIPGICVVTIRLCDYDDIVIRHTIPEHTRTYEVKPKRNFWSSIDSPVSEEENAGGKFIEKFPEYNNEIRLSSYIMEKHAEDGFLREVLERFRYEIMKGQKLHA